MKKNVGGADKSVRFIIGIVLLVVGIFVQMSAGLKIGVLAGAAIALITGTVGF